MTKYLSAKVLKLNISLWHETDTRTCRQYSQNWGGEKGTDSGHSPNQE